MGLFDKFWDILQYFGFFKKSARVLFIGLDNAGKTSLLHMLKYGRLTQNAPTARPVCETLELNSIDIKAFDLGGHMQARRIWREYFDVANALIFLIDASDHEKLHEAKEELRNLLIDDQLAALPLLILGNKIDKPSAMSENQLNFALGISDLVTGKIRGEVDRRPIETFMCSIVERQGYGEGFRWLAQYLD